MCVLRRFERRICLCRTAQDVTSVCSHRFPYRPVLYIFHTSRERCDSDHGGRNWYIATGCRLRWHRACAWDARARDRRPGATQADLDSRHTMVACCCVLWVSMSFLNGAVGLMDDRVFLAAPLRKQVVCTTSMISATSIGTQLNFPDADYQGEACLSIWNSNGAAHLRSAPAATAETRRFRTTN